MCSLRLNCNVIHIDTPSSNIQIYLKNSNLYGNLPVKFKNDNFVKKTETSGYILDIRIH